MIKDEKNIADVNQPASPTNLFSQHHTVQRALLLLIVSSEENL